MLEFAWVLRKILFAISYKIGMIKPSFFMTSFFGCFFIMSLWIVIVVGSQSDWNWFWNERRIRRSVLDYGKLITRIKTASLGTFFIFISIIGYSKTFNSKSEIRYKNTEPTQRMEYLKNQNNRWNPYYLYKKGQQKTLESYANYSGENNFCVSFAWSNNFRELVISWDLLP